MTHWCGSPGDTCTLPALLPQPAEPPVSCHAPIMSGMQCRTYVRLGRGGMHMHKAGDSTAQWCRHFGAAARRVAGGFCHLQQFVCGYDKGFRLLALLVVHAMHCMGICHMATRYTFNRVFTAAPVTGESSAGQCYNADMLLPTPAHAGTVGHQSATHLLPPAWPACSIRSRLPQRHSCLA